MFFENYFLGNDKNKWTENVHHFKTLVQKNIYNGIDLKLCSYDNNLKYDIFVKISSDTPDGLDLAVSKLRRIKIVDSHTLPAIFGQGGSIDEQ